MDKTTSCILIDDDPDEHELFTMALKDTLLNITCAYFSRCSLAIDFYEGEKNLIPDLIFVDWRLADVEGKDCITNLRMVTQLQGSKMYIYSGLRNLMEQDYLDGLKIGFLQKKDSVALLTGELKNIMNFESKQIQKHP